MAVFADYVSNRVNMGGDTTVVSTIGPLMQKSHFLTYILAEYFHLGLP